MGVDYAARKSAKVNRKRRREDGETKRVRKRSGPRRLCRGLCYGEPVVNADELEPGESRRVLKNLKGEDPEKKGSKPRRRRGQGGKASERKSIPAPESVGEEEGASPMKTRTKPLPAKKQAPGTQLGQEESSSTKSAASSKTQYKLSTSMGDLPPPPSDDKKPSRALASVEGDAELRAALESAHPLVRECMRALGHTACMPVQILAWPLLLGQTDIQVVADPGAGKTLAFLLPLLALVADAREERARWLLARAAQADEVPLFPGALILVPARELARQVAAEAKKVERCARVAVGLVHGGVEKEGQIEALRSHGADVMIATPGRLLDLIKDGHIDLTLLAHVVMDEADCILNLGFAPALAALRDLLWARAKSKAPLPACVSRAKPHVALFTATAPPAVAAVAAGWLDSAAPRLSAPACASCISSRVTQVVQVCAEHKKPSKLLKHLAAVDASRANARQAPRVLVFANRIRTVRFLQTTLAADKRRVAVIHSQRTQAERQEALAAFRSGKAQILVATDVAARGLHIRNLSFVVNYDCPDSIQQYIHRVGRTGRLSDHGHALTFFARDMAPMAAAMLQLLSSQGQTVDPNLVTLAKAYRVALEKMGGQLPPASAKKTEEEDSDAEEEPAIEEESEAEQPVEARPAERVAKIASHRSEKRPAINAVLEELGLKPRKKPKKEQGEAPPGSSNSAVDTPPGKEEGRPMFVPSKSFAGARKGYVFKMGVAGVGYYLDQGAGKAARRAKRESVSLEIGRRDRRDAGDKPRPDVRVLAPRAAAEPKKKAHAKPAPPLLPGRMKKARAAHASDSESEYDAAPAASAAAPKAKKGALPGRLRKKLVKERLARKLA